MSEFEYCSLWGKTLVFHWFAVETKSVGIDIESTKQSRLNMKHF